VVTESLFASVEEAWRTVPTDLGGWANRASQMKQRAEAAESSLASLYRELATIFGPAPAKKGATDNERWLHHICDCLTVAGVEFTESGE